MDINSFPALRPTILRALKSQFFTSSVEPLCDEKRVSLIWAFFFLLLVLEVLT